MNQVPAVWGMQRNLRPVNQQVRQNLGVPSHPRVSIRGGAFQLLDASGNMWPAPVIPHPGKQGVWALVCIIVGANPNKSKVFYPEGWDENNPIPPLCFSDNGVAPSSNAQEPQARFCAECEWGKWGSAQSKVTGRDVKACADKKKIAVLVMNDTTGMTFELQIPPASLGELSTYSDMVDSIPFPTGERRTDISDVVTLISFEQGKTGQLNFDWAGWIDSVGPDQNGVLTFFYDQNGPIQSNDGGYAIAQRIDAAWDSGVIDTLVGNRDQPFVPPNDFRGGGMIAVGSQAPALQHTPQVQHHPQPAGPYTPPPGVPVSRPAAPFVAAQRQQQQALPAPQGQAPQPMQGQVLPPQQQPRATNRGGARPGAGRPPTRPRTVAPAPSQALHQPQQETQQQQQPSNVVQHPANQPQQGQQAEGIPPFLNRAGPAWGGGNAGAAPQGGQGGAPQPSGQQNGSGTFAGAGAPPPSLKAALDNAMNLKTEG